MKSQKAILWHLLLVAFYVPTAFLCLVVTNEASTKRIVMTAALLPSVGRCGQTLIFEHPWKSNKL